MPIIAGTLARYFGLRFVNAVLVVFAGIFALVALIDYIELMRRAGDIPNVSAALVAKTSLYRVPQVVERILPFCVLIGAMSCYLNLSRRLELVVARVAGMSAWQFVMPAVVAAFVVRYHRHRHLQSNIAPLCRSARSASKLNFSGRLQRCAGRSGGTFWIKSAHRRRPGDHQRSCSRDQGINLNGVSVFVFDIDGRFKQRIEARAAVLEPGVWRACATPASTRSARSARQRSRNTGSRPISRPSKSAKALPRRKPCRSGNFPCISRSRNTPVL